MLVIIALFSVMFYAASFVETQFVNNTSEYFNSPNYVNYICVPIVDLYNNTKSGCSDFFGDAFMLTSLGINITLRDNDPNNICDYFQPGTTVNDCLYKNGTVEIALCATYWTLVNVLKDFCSEYYTIDSCKYTPLGILQLNYVENPCNSCRPHPTVQFCQLIPVDDNSTALPCSNCQSSES